MCSNDGYEDIPYSGTDAVRNGMENKLLAHMEEEIVWQQSQAHFTYLAALGARFKKRLRLNRDQVLCPLI